MKRPVFKRGKPAKRKSLKGLPETDTKDVGKREAAEEWRDVWNTSCCFR